MLIGMPQASTSIFLCQCRGLQKTSRRLCIAACSVQEEEAARASLRPGPKASGLQLRIFRYQFRMPWRKASPTTTLRSHKPCVSHSKSSRFSACLPGIGSRQPRPRTRRPSDQLVGTSTRAAGAGSERGSSAFHWSSLLCTRGSPKFTETL